MFDLDGTLADTLADIAAAANHALGQLGHEPIELPRYRYLAGQGLERLITDSLGPEHAGQIDEGMKLFRAFYAEHGMDQTKPYDGVPELLDELVRRKVPLSVLSNKPHPATQTVMEKVFGRWTFDVIFGHRPGAPLKPDPASALEIAQMLKVEPQHWLYVGDTKVDMETATAAGMFAVGVTWGFRDEPELVASGARVIIHEPLELLAWM